MLKQNDLKSQIQTALTQIIPPALEQCKLGELSIESEIGKEKAKEFAETFNDLVSEPLAEALAAAIDYYIKNASITGTIITTGTPITQTAVILSNPQPIVNGKLPNTLGIM